MRSGTMVRMGAVLVAIAGAAAAQAGEVFVLGNTQTGHIVVFGNSDDAANEANRDAKAIRETGWKLLFADDARGWGAVACVHHSQGFTFFPATGQPSQADAIRLATAAGQQFQARSGGTFIQFCGPRWNNDGRVIAMGSAGHEDLTVAQPTKPSIDRAIEKATGAVVRIGSHSQEEYKLRCVPPPPSAKAELAPIGNGSVRRTSKRLPPKPWRPADWCPKRDPNATWGVRG